MLVRDALDEAAGSLRAAGVAQPDQDAELLVRHALGWDRAAFLARVGERIDDDTLAALRGLVAQRSRRIPLQHLVGSVEFWKREFLVSPAALIPRPETELLVETALLRLAATPAPRVVDVGTGTGCIALSIAADRPDAEVHAVDVSREALGLARQNAQRLGLERRVAFHLGDLLQPVLGFAGRVDLLASNPPYVDATEIQGLAPEVRDHEPRIALVPKGGDRYSIYRRLAPAAAMLLRPRGLLLLEIGQHMAEEVGRACDAAGMRVEAITRDLQGVPRVMTARRSSE